MTDLFQSLRHIRRGFGDAHGSSRPRCAAATRLVVMAGLLGSAACAIAGGSPEGTLLIINPNDPDSLYLGNYYKQARNIPDTNVLYMNPGASNYSKFAGPNGNIDGLFGYLENTGIEETIHTIVIAPTSQFFISAPGLVTDSCWPVARFSIASGYVLAFSRQQILAGNVPSTTANGYYSLNTSTVAAFDSTVPWLNGVSHPSGRRLYIGALLGYTGQRGNTVAEIREMIDRSVGADGSRPEGTFYFMNTTDQNRNIRAVQYSAMLTLLSGAGGTGEIINDVLPLEKHDVLGVVTGWASPAVNTADFTILPGAFADHLTSWAATFDNGNQTKLSAWIRRGASASAGTVEEPCAYGGKFPHSILHWFSKSGMSIGESWLRSSGFLPFQQLLVGDPLTRPFAYIPSVEHNLPTGVVSGQLPLTPAATTQAPNTSIGSIDTFVNGVRILTTAPGSPIVLDTTTLPDGLSEVRFVAYENTPIKSAGSDSGMLRVDNHGLAASIAASATSGNLSTRFTFDVSASGAAPAELRLLQNGRVVAAADASPASLHVHGQNLGAGKSHVQLEAVFADGRRALSQRIDMEISTDPGTGAGQSPVAYGYTKRVLPGRPFVVELPGSFDNELASATYEVVALPSQANVGDADGPFRIMTSQPNASGPDKFVFRISTPSGQSNIAIVTLIHGEGTACYANCDGSTTEPILNVDDFTCFINAFATGQSLPHEQQVTSYANCDGSTTAPVLNVDDFTCFINSFAAGCP